MRAVVQLLVSALMVASVIPSASAGMGLPERNFTGNQLYENCTSSDTGKQLTCLITVGDIFFGSEELLKIKKTDGTSCYPEGVNGIQVRDMVIKRLRDNPEIRHKKSDYIVIDTTLEAFTDCVVFIEIDGHLLYRGQMKDGLYHGEGELFAPSGGKYVGGWSGGEVHGYGTLYRPDGSIVHQGEYKDGKPHGQGTAYYEDGGKYVDQWRDGKLHCKGTSYYADSSILHQREWCSGEKAPANNV